MRSTVSQACFPSKEKRLKLSANLDVIATWQRLPMASYHMPLHYEMNVFHSAALTWEQLSVSDG